MPTMVSAKNFRSLFETTFLVESCSIIRRVEVTGILGTSEPTYSILYTGVKCSLESRTQRDSRSREKEIVNVGNEYLLKVAFTQDILEKDIFRLYNGIDYIDYAIKPIYVHKIQAGILKKIIVEKLSYLTKLT